ncbi:MAG: hypothetical protein WBO36_02730 [Saprospiraceae bacterium]
MKHIFSVILIGTFIFKMQAQQGNKNIIDISIGYGGIDGLSDMTFISTGYGRELNNGFIILGSYQKGSGLNEQQYNHTSINILGLGIRKAVNTSGTSSINLGLGYRFIKENTSFGNTPNYPQAVKGFSKNVFHGVDIELLYLYNINERMGIYLGGNFTTGIFLTSGRVGSVIYF